RSHYYHQSPSFPTRRSSDLLFTVDEETLSYLKLTGRSEEHIDLVEKYLKENDLFFNAEKEPVYSEVLELDLSTVEPSLSGPKRPQDLILLSDMKDEFEASVTRENGNHGHGYSKEIFDQEVEVEYNDGGKETLKTGDLVIAAITSCTNTSNPYVMLGAGLVA